MKERPILFSAPMVRAILAGNKTVTRRVVKPTGAVDVVPFIGADNRPTGEFGWCPHPCYISKHIRCPYGQPGDRLWVKETHRPVVAHSCAMDACDCADVNVEYQADGEIRYFSDYTINEASPEWCLPKAAQRGKFVPSIHMPRWASRITLEVTGVRVERLQDISEADAKAEGCAPAWLDAEDNETVHADRPPAYRQGFARLWRDINGPDSWDANPWVWVVEFKRIPQEQAA